MRGIRTKYEHWKNRIIFKENNKKNLYVIDKEIDALGNATNVFHHFVIKVNNKQYFDTTNNSLQSILAIERSFLNNDFLYCEVYSNKTNELFFTCESTEGIIKVKNSSEEKVLEWDIHSDEILLGDNADEKDLLPSIFRNYLLFKPAKSTLKKLSDEVDFIKVSASLTKQFETYKDSIDELLRFAKEYLAERGIDYPLSRLEFAKLKNSNGNYCSNKKRIKIDLSKVNSEKELYSTFGHEFGHSFEDLFLNNPEFIQHLKDVRDRLPYSSRYERYYLYTPSEIFARSIETDFVQFCFGENPCDNPSDFLPVTYSSETKKVWYISSEELDSFFKVFKNTVLV